MQHNEQQLDSKTIFEGRVIRLTLDTVRLENGNTATREVVHHGGGAGILALNQAGEVAMVRQFRYALGRELLEIPAGKVENGEDPMHTAMRELEEEIGCTAERLEPFGEVIPTCGYCTEIIWLFRAVGLRPSHQHLDADEFLSVEWLPFEAALALAQSGEIADSKTAVALLKADVLRQKGLL